VLDSLIPLRPIMEISSPWLGKAGNRVESSGHAHHRLHYPLTQNGGNSQGEVVMDKVVDRSGIPDFMYVKWSNQFFGMGGGLYCCGLSLCWVFYTPLGIKR
jgi:hypothetical protein